MVFTLQSGHDFVTESATYKVQRGITRTIYIQELWFLQSAHHLIFTFLVYLLKSPILKHWNVMQSKKISNDQELIQSDPTS